MKPCPASLNLLDIYMKRKVKGRFLAVCLPSFSSGLLVQISSLFIGDLQVNESCSVINHFKLAIALAC